MTGKGKTKSRRTVLRTISGSAVAAAVGTGSVTANPTQDDIDIFDVEKVQKLLNMIGNPPIQRKIVSTLPGTTKQKITLVTGIGDLSYVDFTEDEVAEDMALRFEFSNLKSIPPNELPSKYQSVPSGSDLFLIKDKDGDIITRRSLTEEEEDHIYKLVDSSAHIQSSEKANINGIYCDKLEGIYFTVIGEQISENFLITSARVYNHGKEWSVTNSVTDFDSDNVNIRRDRTQGFENPSLVGPAQSDPSCSGLVFHPCGQCTAGTGLCGGCAPTCAGTVGATCGACILECGYTTDQCCKCLHCIDGISDDKVDRHCPSDLEDKAVDKGGDIIDDAKDAIGGLL